jgi:hypothetical protein
VKEVNCYYHPDREAVAVCSVCKKPLCKECARESNGKIYCADCLQEAQKRKKISIGNPTGIVIITLIVALALVFLLITSRNANLFVLTPKDSTTKTQIFERDLTDEASLDVNISAPALKAIIINESGSKLYSVESIATQEIKVDYTNGKLNIIYPEGSHWLGFLNNPQETLTLSITDKISVNIRIKAGAGNIEVQGGNIKVNQLTIENGAGNVTVSGNNFSGIDISEGAGNIEISGIATTQRIQINNGVGNSTVDLTRIQGDCSLSIKNGVGNSDVFVSLAKGVKAQIETVKFNGDGFIKDNGFYINDAFKEKGEEILIDVASIGNVNIIQQ